MKKSRKKKKQVNKRPYITKKHVMVELIGLLFMFLAFVVASMIITKYDGNIPTKYDANGAVIQYSNGGTLYAFPVIMLFVNVVLALIMHFLPANAWNMPFEVKPGKEEKVFSDVAMMLAAIQLEMGAYVFAFSVLYTAKDIWKVIVTLMLVLAITYSILRALVKARRDNEG